MNADYTFLTPATIAAYIDSRPDLAGLVDTSTLEVEEVGDGNLNLVFVCRDADGRGICLKQSLPYVRLVGEAWPLTPDRVLAEDRGLSSASQFAPDLVPAYYGIDKAAHVLAMENLIGWKVLRGELNEGKLFPGVEQDVGRFIARLAFNTSSMGVEQNEMKARVAGAVNPELCRITEDLVFTEPYVDVPNNSFVDELGGEIAALRSDKELLAQVGVLKFEFMTRAEALVHGDLHTGSVMVRRDETGSHCRVIDPEFCFYGPIGFDVGAMFANVLAARCRAAVLGRPDTFTGWLDSASPAMWESFTTDMRAQWDGRLDPTWTDGFLDQWLARIEIDAIGFAGCKAIRRVIGLAKVSDIEDLEPDEHVLAATMMLRTAARWIRERTQLATIASANDVFFDVRDEVLA